jgi:hypothetical protein
LQSIGIVHSPKIIKIHKSAIRAETTDGGLVEEGGGEQQTAEEGGAKQSSFYLGCRRVAAAGEELGPRDHGLAARTTRKEPEVTVSGRRGSCLGGGEIAGCREIEADSGGSQDNRDELH